MVERKPSPKLLVTWAIAGAVLAASTWFLSFLHIPRLAANGSGFWAIVWVNRLRFVVYSAPFAIGIAISLLAERRFKRGFEDGIWSEAQLEPVRALLAKPFWSWTGWLLLGVAVASIVFYARTAYRGGAFVYLLLFPNQTVMRIRQLVTPKVDSSGVLNDWQDVKPIHSNHWGEQPTYPTQ